MKRVPIGRVLRSELKELKVTLRYIRVPQGFVLGPLLFLIFINGLAGDLTFNHLFCADDVKLSAPRGQ